MKHVVSTNKETSLLLQSTWKALFTIFNLI
jgi:hypothetical protein